MLLQPRTMIKQVEPSKINQALKQSNLDAVPLGTGIWEGEYIDISGQRVYLIVEIVQEGKMISVSFEGRVPSNHTAWVFGGVVTGFLHGDDVHLELVMGDPAIRLPFQGKVFKRAQGTRAICGVISEELSDVFVSGVWILWNY